MTDKSEKIPLAKVLSPSDMSGRGGKVLEVPPGRKGIVIKKDGEAKTYEPGKHTILSPSERLSDSIQVGIIPAGPFSARFKAENLLSKDDELLDAGLICEVEVLDPARFFTQQVVPQGVIFGNTLTLPAETAWDILGSPTRRFDADDLLAGDPTERMLPLIHGQIEAVITGQGLYLDFILIIAFTLVADRILAAEKALSFRERLRDVEFKDKVSEIQSKEKLKEFIQEEEPELIEAVGLHPVVEGEKKPASLIETFLTWIEAEVEGAVQSGRFRVNKLLGGLGKKEKPRRKRRRARRWWLPRVALVIIVAFIAILLTLLVNWIAGDARSDALWGFHLAVWSAVAVVLFDSVRVLMQKREELESDFWSEPGYTQVDELVGNDRKKADALIRKRCKSDLTNAQDMLNDIRSRVYKSGNEDMALKIRTLEKKLGRVRENVLDPLVGVPPYVTDMKIKRKMWQKMLDYDEGLLVRVSALSEDAQSLQQKYAEGKFNLDLLNQLEARLDAFLHHFKNRSQEPKASEEDQKEFRM